MKKIFLTMLFAISLISISFAQVPATNPVVSAVDASSIIETSTTHVICRAVWIGTSQSDDFYINGHWVTFQGATAGEIIPIQATGARITSGSAAPNAGDVVFLY